MDEPRKPDPVGYAGPAVDREAVASIAAALRAVLARRPSPVRERLLDAQVRRLEALASQVPM